MHKSSSLTFVYKYLFAPLWAGGFLIAMISDSTSEERIAAGMVGWGLCWLIMLMIRLRNVVATNEGLIIKNFRGQEIINYKDIEYVSQIAMINPILVSLKYRDHRTGDSNKILVMPSISSELFTFNFLEEVEMTTFIRVQTMRSNPTYNRDLEPSRWLTIRLIALTGISASLIVGYFLASLSVANN